MRTDNTTDKIQTTHYNPVRATCNAEVHASKVVKVTNWS
jgi:hypothetical protein